MDCQHTPVIVLRIVDVQAEGLGKRCRRAIWLKNRDLCIGSPLVSAVCRAKCTGIAEAVVVKLVPAGAEQAVHEADTSRP